MEQSIIKVHTQKLSDDSMTISGYLKDLALQKENLQSSIQALNQMWSGDAYDAFVKSVNTDIAALQTVIDNLTQVYTYEQKAKDAYEKCENQVAKLIDEISIKEM